MKKRVAFCLRDMQLGGVESVLIRIFDELVQDKHLDLTLVTFVNITEPVFVDWLRANPSVKQIVLYPSKCFGTKMPRFFLWRIIKHAVRDVYRFVRRFFIARKLAYFDTLVDFHDFGFVHEFRKVRVRKKIAWFHSSLNVFMKRKFVNCVKDYDNVVVLTDDCVNDLKKMFPQYSNKFIRIYNPIDVKGVQQISDIKPPITGEYFCCVARMSYDKDIKTVMDAFDAFWQTHQKVKLVFVGGGNKTYVFKNYADALKSGKNILFVGPQKNPFVYIKYAIANILSSYGEGLPTVLIEGQSVGVVNIASDCKYGPREILLDGDAGILFEPGNCVQLTKAMDDVCSNVLDTKKMVNLAIKELKRFDKVQVIKQIKSLIS